MWGRRNRGEATGILFFGQGSARTAEEKWIRQHGRVLAGVKSQRGVTEQSLKGPAGGQVNAEATGSLANAGAEFEQAGAQSFDLRRAPGLRQMPAKQVDQVVGEAVQQQAEGVGQKAMAAQAVGAKTVFEFLDAVLALAAIVVEGKDLRGATGCSW